MHKPISLVVVGSINMDLVVQVDRFPKEGETLTGTRFFTAPGGKGANQAVAAARLGARTAMIGCVGIDQFGKELVQYLKNEKVSMRRVGFVAEAPTGTAVITVNTKAQNQIIVIPGANHAMTEDNFVQSWKTLSIKPDAVLLQLEIPLPIVMKAAQTAKESKALVILNPAPASPIPQELLRYVDYVIPNEHEAKLLTKKESIEDAAHVLRAMGARHVIVTLGQKGSLILNDTIEYVKPFTVTSVDPTAAGDAFVAAFTVVTLEGKSLIEAVQWANAAGALATTKIGAQPSLPTRKQVIEFIPNISNTPAPNH